MDLIIEYELVKPNGQVTLVNSSSDPDLFFALKVRRAIRIRPMLFITLTTFNIGWTQ